MSTFTGAQTAQKLDPTGEFLKELEAKSPQGVDKDFYIFTIKDLLYKVGNFLAMCEELGICDELIKDALAHQKEIMSKTMDQKMAKNTNKE